MSVKEILERPFDSKLIYQRTNQYGSFSYVKGDEYIKRLNEAFGCIWSFKIIEYKIIEDEIIVKGKLTVEIDNQLIVKEAFGGGSIKRRKEDKSIISLVDDHKSAATDALKKAASMLGIGLHLYSSDNSVASNQGYSQKQSNPGALTDKQLNSIRAIASRLHWTRERLDKVCLERYGITPEKLDKKTASDLISKLNDYADNIAQQVNQ